MRIAIAGLMHESNTFARSRTDRAAFVAQGLAHGEQIRREWAEAHHEVGGFLASAEGNFEAIPLVMAWATPAGPVADAVFDEVVGTIIDGVKRERPDGLLLALHGAMVTDSYPDADIEVLAKLRAALGPDFPIAVTFDLHGNLSLRLEQVCDLAIAYRTNPHVDQRLRGKQAARLLMRWLRKEIRPRLAVAKPNMLINIMKQDTAQDPLLSFIRRVDQMETVPGILTASLLPGFAYADVPHMGPTVLAVADGDIDFARREANRLSDDLYAARSLFNPILPEAPEAVRLALATDKTPVVLVEAGDNVGGGSAADSTIILAELLRQGATDWAVMLFAPDEVRQCAAAGVGSEVTLTVGGKVDRLHGDPVRVTGHIKLLHDGTYTEEQVRHGGKRINHMGPTALVELPNNSVLALTTLRHPPFSLGALTCLGIRPDRKRILVVKAAIAYKAAYGLVAGSIIEVDTPGLTAINPARLPYKHARLVCSPPKVSAV